MHTEINDALGASLITGSSVEGDTDFYRRLARETGGPILEVGCGTGRVAAALAADGHEVVGIDLSAPMLRLATQRRAALSADAAARLSFHRADLATLAARGLDLPVELLDVLALAYASGAELDRMATFGLGRMMYGGIAMKGLPEDRARQELKKATTDATQQTYDAFAEALQLLGRSGGVRDHVTDISTEQVCRSHTHVLARLGADLL